MNNYLFNQENYECISTYARLNHDYKKLCYYNEQYTTEVANRHVKEVLENRGIVLRACDKILSKLGLSADVPTIQVGEISLKESLLTSYTQRKEFFSRYADDKAYVLLTSMFNTREILKNRAKRKRDGQVFKTTYKLRKIMKKIAPDLLKQEEYAQISYEDLERLLDKIQNDASAKGPLMLSIDPAEILTCSMNNYDWDSCFTYDGVHAAAPLLLLENPVGILYLSTRKMECLGTSVDDKKWRTFVYFGSEGLFVHSSGYPSSNRAIVELANQKLKETLNLESFTDPEIIPSKRYGNIMYYDSIDSEAISLGQDEFHLNSTATCPFCGDNEVEFQDEVCGCTSCVDAGVSCEHCGGHFHEDDIIWIDDTEELWCLDCFKDNGFACSECGDYTSRGYVDAHGKEYCTYCAFDNLSFCDSCGEFYPNDEVMYAEDGEFCEDCRDELLSYCTKCSTWSWKKDVVLDAEGNCYCNSCKDDVLKNEKDEE